MAAMAAIGQRPGKARQTAGLSLEQCGRLADRPAFFDATARLPTGCVAITWRPNEKKWPAPPGWRCRPGAPGASRVPATRRASAWRPDEELCPVRPGRAARFGARLT